MDGVVSLPFLRARNPNDLAFHKLRNNAINRMYGRASSTRCFLVLMLIAASANVRPGENMAYDLRGLYTQLNIYPIPFSYSSGFSILSHVTPCCLRIYHLRQLCIIFSIDYCTRIVIVVVSWYTPAYVLLVCICNLAATFLIHLFE